MSFSDYILFLELVVPFIFSGLFCLLVFGERILCITQAEASNFYPSWFIPQLLGWKMWGTIPDCYFGIQINDQDDHHIFRLFWSHCFGLHIHLPSFAFHYTHLIETISFLPFNFSLTVILECQLVLQINDLRIYTISLWNRLAFFFRHLMIFRFMFSCFLLISM